VTFFISNFLSVTDHSRAGQRWRNTFHIISAKSQLHLTAFSRKKW